MPAWTGASCAGCDGQSRDRHAHSSGCRPFRLERSRSPAATSGGLRAKSCQPGSADHAAHFARFTAGAQSPGVILPREAISISAAIEELIQLPIHRRILGTYINFLRQYSAYIQGGRRVGHEPEGRMFESLRRTK
jgi:hypothetical protein